MLVGKLVNLRAVEPSDYRQLWVWYNNPKVMKYWGKPGYTPSLPEVQRREETEAARSTSKKYIIETKDGTAIGQIDYYDLNWEYRHTWTSIMIADEHYWGGGYGTDAMRTLLRYLFEQLGLHRVTLTVHQSNERARRSYRKSGFVEEGVLREWQYIDGEWVNGVIMSVLDREFRPEG